MHIYLVRHGESNANASRTVPGKDETLSDLGKMQAAQLAERIKNLDIDTIIASDYIRAQETAKPTSDVHGLPIVVEASFGEMYEPTKLVGMPDECEAIEQYRATRNGLIESDSEWKEDDGDSFADLFRRFEHAEQFLKERTEDNIVVFSHAYYLAGFVSKILMNTDTPST